ncbi:MAG: hypothetical protein M3Q31_17295 [Actinomycetota bacterium]|nr:hypothetical protein [Actinomycetota bacterium]
MRRGSRWYEAPERFTTRGLLVVERSALDLAREHGGRVGVIRRYAIASHVLRSRVR